MQTSDFRTYLQNELIERIKKNPQYSLRAFAGHLTMDPSTLSKMLKGKRPIGKKAIVQLASKLGLSKAQTAKFLNLEGSDESQEAQDYKLLALDQFAVISDWYHFAILELTMVKGFKPDHSWIAKALGLKSVEVEAAVDRLVRVGMLEVTKKGKWIDLSSGFTTNIGPDMSSSAHRRLQEQLLQKAIVAQQFVPVDKRDHSAMTMAIDGSKIKQAKERIRKFRRDLTQFLTEGQTKDSVFSLNIALFPLTKLENKGDNYEN